MLTRNCAINKLLNEGDFNVRVTVFDYTKCSDDPERQKGAWIEAIRDSIGGGIVNSHAKVKLIIEHANGQRPFRGIISGNLIPEMIRVSCFIPESLRISIAPANDTSKLHTWIFV
ncbi:MAG: hypothetical protein IKK84_01100 [Clostridia bacterium]|nr:hypothetical protein [Mogibacterium sp.]MBR6613348.1 hypothetical protein [Clostridia bacterium]MBR6641390.1 hypothetical protein [Clostridia bacterium]